MEKKIDWSKAPEGATHYCVSSIDDTGWRDYSGEVGKYWKDGKWKSFMSSATALGCVKHEARPTTTIKSLEERIKDRALERLEISVQGAAMKLRIIAGVASNQPSGINDMTVAEAIDAISAAIVRLRGPAVADEALNRALEELADRLEPGNLLQAQAMGTPPRERCSSPGRHSGALHY